MKRSYGFVAYAFASPIVASIRQRHRNCDSGCSGRAPGDLHRVKVLLVRTRLGRWDFPKGTFDSEIHGDRTPIDTAKRELFEETGLKPDDSIIGIDTSTTFTCSYKYNTSKGEIRKDVCLYLCRLKDEVVSNLRNIRGKHKDRSEVSCHDFVWLDELASRFTFPEDSALAKKVVRHLTQRLAN